MLRRRRRTRPRQRNQQEDARVLSVTRLSSVRLLNMVFVLTCNVTSFQKPKEMNESEPSGEQQSVEGLFEAGWD